MKSRLLCFLIGGLILFTSFTFNNDKVVNYYGLPESLTFNDLTYNLSWSSHPNDIYYKQEYIPTNNSIDHFNDMLMIDFIITDMPVIKAVEAQVAKIQERKKTDVVCNYRLLENKQTGEYILDFLMGESQNGFVNMVEWNGYHYKAYTDKQGHKGVLLFGVSHREYDDVTGFLKSLSAYRNRQLKLLNTYDVPEIQIK